jgi:hypothetical protein
MADPTPPKQAEKSESSAKAKKAEAEVESQDKQNAMLGAFSQLLFVILPFIVIAITLGHRGQLGSIFFLPEWSIVSAVIVGQTIVKVVSISLGKNVKAEREPIVLMVSILLVCLLVPTLVVLSIVLTSDKVSISMAASQAVLFLLSAMVFWGFDWLENWIRNS